MKKSVFFGLLLFLSTPFIFGGRQADPPEQPAPAWGGSRSIPVHRIPLRDEFDQPIVPTIPYPFPFSFRTSCAPCHDYAAISRGFHFNASSAKDHGRMTEPWFLVDRATGTVLPISYRPMEGAWHPEHLGLSRWDFTLLFGRHQPGGGSGDPREDNMDPESRWNVSGSLEINCLACHSASFEQSHSEWAVQVLRENFRWAAAAASGLGDVGGMASRLPAFWDIYDGPNPDDTEYAVVPSVRYREDLFNSRHEIPIPLSSQPEDRLCLNCHSVTPVGTSKSSLTDDVHSASGMACVDCHRGNTNHTIIRGYEAEAGETGESLRDSFTCRGCHLGAGFPGGRKKGSGRMGAPYPLHKGLPAVHFERLSCTVCHSGPLVTREPVRVRTSRANRLGIHGIARWYTEQPAVLEPVFVPGADGKLSPHRLAWPAFWARLEGETATPLTPEHVMEAGAGYFDVNERIARLILALSGTIDIEGPVVLILNGRLFEPNADGGLNSIPSPVDIPAGEIFWGVRSEGTVIPIVPEFDPAAEEPDTEAELRIEHVLTALGALAGAPGSPGYRKGRYLYRIVDGYPDKSEQDSSAAEAAFVWLSDNGPLPLVPPFDADFLTALAGKEETLTKSQIIRVLQQMQKGPEGSGEGSVEYAYISNGYLHRLDEKGDLSFSDHPAAAPVTWPLAHNVRPAQQSLGSNGCKDCHRVDSPFLFASIQGTGPYLSDHVKKRSAVSFMGLNGPYHRLFGLSFIVRPLLKWLLFGAALLMLLVLLTLLTWLTGRAMGFYPGRVK
ncbi:MAG: cytochrome c3 family protein [Acidobacteria bacterium]|nr:cytochrome c3 family protein [Acidobacteriota bacterium]MBU1474652.1 cytochrome c3 family protein [Acidobacteriota bacterium]